MTADLECIASSDTLALEEANYTWDPVNNTFTTSDYEGDDAWIYWSVYSYQVVNAGQSYIRWGERTDPIKFGYLKTKDMMMEQVITQ